MTAFPEWNANHRQCVVCHGFVPIADEMEIRDTGTKYVKEWQKFSVHTGECTETIEAATLSERRELEARLIAVREKYQDDLEAAASKEDAEYFSDISYRPPGYGWALMRTSII